jgi:DNA-directed RNA polymerase sigma subunit (sigma70/sigma32)
LEGEELTLEDTGRELKLTRERIRQIQKKALTKLGLAVKRGELDPSALRSLAELGMSGRQD